jgi:hypothetical protein
MLKNEQHQLSKRKKTRTDVQHPKFGKFNRDKALKMETFSLRNCTYGSKGRKRHVSSLLCSVFCIQIFLFKRPLGQAGRKQKQNKATRQGGKKEVSRK